MAKVAKPSEILGRHFKKLQRQNRAFSLRALAKKVGVSHSFLSRILTDKAKAPPALLGKLITSLKIDAEDATVLRQLFRQAPLLLARGQDNSEYELLPEGHLPIMRKWWNLAILDLLTCDLRLTTKNLQEYLPVPAAEIQKSVGELAALGLLEVKGEKIRKTARKIRIPARGPNEFTRAFYEQTLALAAGELKRTDPESYENRSILGFTCAVDRKNIPLAKQKLAAALRECAEILADGKCDDVFIVQGQLFSIIRKT